MTQVRSEIVGFIPRMRDFAAFLTRSRGQECDDLVQDTILRALQAEHQFQAGTNLIGWLCAIMRNLHINSRRNGPRFIPVAPDDNVLLLREAPGSADAGDDCRDISRIIARLPAEQVVSLRMTAIDCMPYEQIAAATGVKIGTVKSRVNRARSIITQEMRRAAQ